MKKHNLVRGVGRAGGAACLIFVAGCSVDQSEFDTVGKHLTSASPVFINEFHYDNTGADQGEAIEVAGPAGTNLSGYSLVLYNGNGGAVYTTTPLSGIIPDQGNGYGTLSFSYPSNGIQNGSPDGIALAHGTELLAFLSFEGTFTGVGGPAAGVLSTDIGIAQNGSEPVGASLGLVGTGTSYADFTWTAFTANSFGSINVGQTLGGGDTTGDDTTGGGDDTTGGDGDGDGDQDVCGGPVTLVSAVQGPGAVSPLEDQTVTIEGVVVGDFQGGGENLGGFFVQDTAPDADPSTSEGIFVFDQSLAVAVAVGDRVRVTGLVTEYFELTEISADRVTVCGTADLPAPTAVALPVADLAAFEAVEGMLVNLTDLSVTETYDLGRYGEVVLSGGGRLFHPNNGAGATVESNARRRILLDDGRDNQNPTPVPYLAADGTLRLGDHLSSITAVLHYAFGAYRLQPLDRGAISFERANARTSAPVDVGGNVKVASLNVLNYFTTLGDRGANTAAELGRQRAKLVEAVLALDADVIGLMEIENSPVALDDFVASINAAADSTLYQKANDPAFTGTDAIRTALLFKPASVRLEGPGLSSTDPVFSRPPIAQQFSYLGNSFTVVVNHFKSKGSCPADLTDENGEQGQGCWNVLRVAQADALLAYITQLKTTTGDDDVVILGDLNSYLQEAPILRLEDGGLSNQIRSVPDAARYSYVFNGESGVLDYALTTPSVVTTGATIWHINADEPRILDYNQEFNPPSLYQPDAFRSSDHDPVLIGLDLAADPGQLLHDFIQRFEAVPGLNILDRASVLVRAKLALQLLRFEERNTRFDRLDPVAVKLAKQTLKEAAKQMQDLGKRRKLLAVLAQELYADLQRIIAEL